MSTYTQIHICTCVHTHTYMCMHANTHTHPHTHTHTHTERNTHLIWITVKLGEQREQQPIRSTAGERATNRETPGKIRSVGRYALSPMGNLTRLHSASVNPT